MLNEDEPVMFGDQAILASKGPSSLRLRLACGLSDREGKGLTAGRAAARLADHPIRALDSDTPPAGILGRHFRRHAVFIRLSHFYLEQLREGRRIVATRDLWKKCALVCRKTV